MKFLLSLTAALLLLSCNSKTPPPVEQQEPPFSKTLPVRSSWVLTVAAVPKWLQGAWQNTAESNTANMQTLMFDAHAFRLTNGFLKSGEQQTALQATHIVDEQLDSLYVVRFQSGKDSLRYEFKSYRADWTEKPLITYAFWKNGKCVREHYTSVNLVFTKLETPIR